MARGITVPVVQSGLEASIQDAAKRAGPLTLSATVDPSSFKRLAQPLGRVSGLATEFEKSIAASNARVIAFGASVGIINGVQNAFASLVKTTIEVEKSLTNIAVISGKTTDELQPFSRALFEIAKTTSQSFQTASEAALEFSRQGLSLDETLKRTQDALTLTRFTSLSAAEAVDVLTAAANSFGETGITTSEILNKLVAVDTKFAVSAEDLAKGLSRAGSIAQEVGVNFDELNAIVTIAQERTARGGAVIGNAFKTIFTRIRSDETIQALQSIGIYSFDAEGRLKPVVGLLEELAGKISTLSETKRIEVLEAIASKYNINVLTALVDDLGSTTSKFREARDVSAGAQNEAYQRQIELNKTLDAVITRVVNSAAQLADTLGRIGVTDSLKSLLNFFDNILTGINDVIDSEGIGGTIAKGLISGLSGVFFKIGIPLLLAIFVKLTKDIAQFGAESLKTILGINKEVRERQALEQAVVNTLIKDQQVMANILSLSGDRRKQEEYLLSVYNRQLAALQQVQSIAAGVAPALQAAGLSATSGTIKKRAAGGYLPAEEARDVRRGVGGASPSSKVVEIPNFSFGGGKRGTMVANTSEYIVPNYAGGSGTAIFNQDMAKEYGLPPGAKKITASGGFVPASGFVPNFVAQKTEEFKKIAPLSVKEIAIKNSRAAREKDARFENSDKADDNDTFAANIKILRQDKSNADYNKQSNAILKNDVFQNFNKREKNISPQYESLIKRYKASGVDQQSISRLTTLVDNAQPGDGQAVVNIKSAIKGIEGEIDASKKLKTKIAGGNRYFDLASGEEVKTRVTTPASNILKKVANRFLSEKNIKNEREDNIEEQATVVLPSDGIISNASRGYIPNFAELNDKGIYAGLVGETAPDNKPDVQTVTRYVTPTEKGLSVYNTGIKSADSVTFDVYRVPKKNEFKLKSIREALGNTGKNLAIDLAREVTGGALGNNIAEQKLEQTFNPGSLQGFANTIFEASVGALLSDKSFQDYSEQAATSLFDLNITGNSLIKKNFGIKDSVNALEVKGASTPELLNSIAEKIYKATAGGREAFTKRGKVYIEDPGRANNKSIARAFVQGGTPFVEIKPDVFRPIEGEFDASKYKLLKNPPGAYKTGASGYIPNYADPSTSLAIEKISDSSLQGKLDTAAEKAYGGFTEKRPIKAGISKRFAAGTQNTPATLKFREALEKKGAGLEPLLNRPYGFMGLQLSTAPAGATFSISDPESVRKFNNPFPTEPEASRKPALVAVANYREPTRDEIKKGVKPDVVAPQGQYANVSYATMFGAPVQLPALGVKSPAKKASFGYVPNFADLFVDYDHTIFTEQLGKVDEFNNQRALINEVTEKEAKGMTEEQLKAREEVRSAAVKKQKDLLTPFGRKLLESGKPFKLVTSRWNDYKTGITSSLLGLGFKIRGEEDVFALGREFSEENYKIDNPKFAEEMKKPEGERNKRIKPKIEPLAPQKKALFFKERAPQMATGDIDFVDNDAANLQAVKSLMPKINTFTPEQYMAKLLAPQGVKGAKASLGYIPNFADNDPLKEAIGREVAAGVAPARVRVTQDGRLKNRDNPDGLAVINTRDEPNGKIPNDFRERGMRAAMASRGFIPNFADAEQAPKVAFNKPSEISKDDYRKLKTAIDEEVRSFAKSATSREALIKKVNDLAAQYSLSQESAKRLAVATETAANKVGTTSAASGGPSAASSASGESNEKPFQLPVDLSNKSGASLGAQKAVLESSIQKSIDTYKAELEAGKNVAEAKKRLDKEVEKQIKEYQLTRGSASQVRQSVAQNVGQGGPKKDIDIGKFLVLQTVVTGLTSSLQAFSEQGSTTANVIEGVNAGLTGLITALTLASNLNPYLKVLVGGVTALASAAPLLSRAYENSLTTFEKTIKALDKLADEAEKTGRAVSPEEFLKVFDQAERQAQAKTEQVRASEKVKQVFNQPYTYAPSEGLNKLSFVKTPDNDNLKRLAIAFSAAGIIDRKGDISQSSKDTLNQAIVLKARTNPVNDKINPVDAIYSDVDIEATLKKLREIAATRALREVKTPQLDRTVSIKAAMAENEILLIRQNILEAIFNKELSINEAYNKKLRSIDEQNKKLEVYKSTLSETQYAQIKSEQDLSRLRAEAAKDEQANINQLKASLSELKDKGLGTLLGEKNEDDLRIILDAFEKAQGNVLNPEFINVFSQQTQTQENPTGTSTYNLLGETRNEIGSVFRKASQGRRSINEKYKQGALDVIGEKDSVIPEQQKLTEETAILNLTIARTTGNLGLLEKAFDGNKKFTEDLGTETARLENSLAKARLQSEIGVALAEKKLQTDVELLNAETKVIEAENKAAKTSGAKERIEALRISMLAKLTQSERKAGEENQASIGMISQKIKADRDAIDRQTNLIEAENDAYNEEVKKANIISLRRSVLAKLVQSERKAEEENQVSIDTTKQRYQASLAAIRRQAALTEEENRAIGTTADLNAVTAGLTLARAKLIESNRKAEEQNLIDIAMARENFDAEANSLRRKRKLNESLLEATDQEDFNQQATIELMGATADLTKARRKAVAALDAENLNLAIDQQISKKGTENILEIGRVMAEGGALSKAGVQGDYAKQADARIFARRTGGRTDLTYAESEDILKGRGETITDKLDRSGGILMDEAQSFQDIIGKSTPKLFADGMAEAMQTALNQADNLGEALRGVAMSFLKNLQSAFLQSASQQIVASILPKVAEGGYIKGYASGGLVTGGSGYKDDILAGLSGGEYVIRKSSVQKYGVDNLNKLNSGEPPKFAGGGIFLPGVRGQGQISGYKDLTAFANQRTTSGATDVLAGSDTSAFASLEDQSVKLSAYALMNEDDTINQEIRSAQEQARNIIAEREAYRTAERKAFQKQLVGTVASAALSFGVGKLSGALFGPKTGQIPEIAGTRQLTEKIAPYDRIAGTIGGMKIPSPNVPPINLQSPSSFFENKYGANYGLVNSDSLIQNKISSITMPRIPGRAYGGMIPRFADGGTPTDKVQALVMGGEYIMSEKATKKYGKQFFDSINQGRAPRFADGGQVSTSEPSFAEKASASSDSKGSSATNVSININVTGGTSETQTQGDTKQDGIDYKKMSEQIKQIVITTINEEKRLGGSLRPRG